MEMSPREFMDVCGTCAEVIPDGSQFCPRCGAVQPRHLDGSNSEPNGSAAPTEWAWCEIEWVRSFRGSEFQARPLTPGGDQNLKRSPLFRWRGLEPPSEGDADARQAHETLVRQLVAADWEPVGESGPWYAERFRRPAALPSQLVPHPVPAPVPQVVPPSPELVPTRAAPSPAAPSPLPAAAAEPVVHGAWARLGIIAITVFSVAVILFTLLVVAGAFRQ
jgi:hypothetical protein